MQVETFECSETAAEPIEAGEEAVSIIEQLELDGQKSLVRRKGETPTRSPYREIRQDENFVYRTLCPTYTALQKYDAGPVPLRILQIAAHASEIYGANKLYVWHQAESVEKDPVLVAYEGHYDFSPNKVFILARWGEELESFPTLLKRACEKARTSLLQQAEGVLTKVKAATDEELLERGPNRSIDW